MKGSSDVTWTSATKKGVNLGVASLEVRFAMNIGKTMTLDVEDGAHKLKNWRLKDEERSKRDTQTLKTALVQLLVVVATGSNKKMLSWRRL